MTEAGISFFVGSCLRRSDGVWDLNPQKSQPPGSGFGGDSTWPPRLVRAFPGPFHQGFADAVIGGFRDAPIPAPGQVEFAVEAPDALLFIEFVEQLEAAVVVRTRRPPSRQSGLRLAIRRRIVGRMQPELALTHHSQQGRLHA